ncbi:MAG: hypothetical protein IJ721_00190 [Bacteroidales bacterium]|nr:hypothetical protein [Bacteroidales bacterium]
MKKTLILFGAAFALVSCQSLKEEWQPVFTLSYDEPAAFVPVDMDGQVNTTIAQLKALYTQHGKPVQLEGNIVIKGQVTTSDENGNVYRELYLQDETGAIDLKLGKSSSYDDYKVGQILYVKCGGLTLGEYGYSSSSYGGAGLLQLGMLGDGWKDYLAGYTKVEPEYETAYIDGQALIATHVFKGRILPESDRIQPRTDLTGAQLDAMKDDIQNDLVGQLVTLKGVKYGNSVGGREVFALFYPNSNLNHTKNDPWNRVFLSSPTNRVQGADYTFGITTWAMSKNKFSEYIQSGVWDEVSVGSGATQYGPIATTYTPEEYFGYKVLYKQECIDHAAAQSVSHYFLYDGAEVQVRTSGYARFADTEIPADIRDGSRSIDITGILTRYQGSAQFTLLELPE